MNHPREYFTRNTGTAEKKKFVVTPSAGFGFGDLFGELRARRWWPRKINPATEEPIKRGEKGGVWIFVYTGYEDDEAVKFAKRQPRVSVSSEKVKGGR